METAARTIDLEYRPTTSITAYANNARTHSDEQIQQIVTSIETFGFTNPILIDETGGIIAGHGRLLAAQRMNMDSVPTIMLTGLSEAQRRAYVLADNKIALNSGWDKNMLAIELTELKALDMDSLTGFSDKEMTRYMTVGGDEETGVGKPAPPTNPKTKFGDLIKMGDNILMCGDCRDEFHMAELFGDEKLAVAITSPPYAAQRKYDTSSDFDPVPPDEYGAWFNMVQHNIATHMADDGSLFVNIKEHCDDGQRVLYVKELAIMFVRQFGWRFVEEYIWTHGGTPKMPHRRFKNGWEPIFHFTKGEHKFRPDAVMHETTSAVDWGGGHPADQDGMAALTNTADDATDTDAKGVVVPIFAYPSNVLKIGKNMESWAHGAMYPTKLPEFFIRAFSDVGDIVFDPFMGSGSTMIAAEKWQRKSRGMEISPAYCDVIVERWEQYTGNTAEWIK